MAYVASLDELVGLIPQADLIESLDDNNDGQPDDDAWAEVVAVADEEIDAALVSAGKTTPWPEPLPAHIKRAAKILVVNACWLRRGIANHPRVEDVKQVRATLARIAKSEEPLTVNEAKSAGAAKAITEPLQTRPSGGGIVA